MAKTAKKTDISEKLEQQDFDIFQALAAIDNKRYDYFDSLTEEQQRKFVPHMMLHWMSSVIPNGNVSEYYLLSAEHNVNKYIYNETVSQHPKLIWLMMCAASAGMNGVRHNWIPHLSARITLLRENAKSREIKEYFSKIYTGADSELLDELSKEWAQNQTDRRYLAEHCPTLKYSDIDVLSKLITKQDREQYEKDLGN